MSKGNGRLTLTRPINPNEGFWRQLEVYESQLARKDAETEAKDSLVDSAWAKESSSKTPK
jgi:hypothetical protein